MSPRRTTRSRLVLGATAAALSSTILLPAGAQAATPHPPTAASITTPAASTTALSAVSLATAELGKPYVWGAAGPHAFDCAGLVQYVYRQAGIHLPRTTYEQVNAGVRIPVSQLRPGDLVFYYSSLHHVAIYIGNGKIIHASHPGRPVNIAPLHSMPIAAAVRVA